MTEQEQKIDELLSRGTIVEILPDKESFRRKLVSGERLRFYIGFDATAPTLHLSHAKNLMLLEEFRKLGHETIILFGDFTARIGDPTGGSSSRKQLSREDVLSNIEQWKKQIAPIVDFDDPKNPPKIRFNHDWLSKLTFEDAIELASNFTVQQMLERDMFERRMDAGEPIRLHEFLYPLMQGYDSVALDVDVELCGTDQIFNALVGRTLLKRLKEKEKFVVAVTLMENPKTGELMSKSRGTGIFLNTTANEMFGQAMSQPDEMIEILLTHCTHLQLGEVAEIMKAENPRDAKVRLAKEIVALYHGAAEAAKAEEYFVNTFSKKEIPEDIREMKSTAGVNITDVIVEAGFAESKSDARRKIEQGGVSIDGEKISLDALALDKAAHDGKVMKVGKKDFVKIIF
ncbi:MAG: tyrosine--tRNA ligase [Candidatus Moranbacteria bacterium]|nr:tyrosine--tRNA ligase [Candidatus Moranbacteria bacterium]